MRRARNLARRRTGPRRSSRIGRCSQPGIEQVARFGTVLHVSGTDKAELDATVERYRADNTPHRWSLQVSGPRGGLHLPDGRRARQLAGDGKPAA